MVFNQFENPDCVMVHRTMTGPEIMADMDREGLRVDAFIDAVASGATLSGVGACLKERDSSVFIRAVEPAESPVLSGGTPGSHGISGIGFGIVPANFHRDVVDDICRVNTTGGNQRGQKDHAYGGSGLRHRHRCEYRGSNRACTQIRLSGKEYCCHGKGQFPALSDHTAVRTGMDRVKKVKLSYMNLKLICSDAAQPYDMPKGEQI